MKDTSKKKSNQYHEGFDLKRQSQSPSGYQLSSGVSKEINVVEMAGGGDTTAGSSLFLTILASLKCQSTPWAMEVLTTLLQVSPEMC